MEEVLAEHREGGQAHKEPFVTRQGGSPDSSCLLLLFHVGMGCTGSWNRGRIKEYKALGAQAENTGVLIISILPVGALAWIQQGEILLDEHDSLL